MSLSRSYISFLSLMAMGTVATALQVNIYSDHNCQNFIESVFPGDCDPLPQPDGGIGSWLIVCQNNFDDNCENITMFSSNGCSEQHAVSALGCSCNADPLSNDNRRCQSTVGLGAHFWGERAIMSDQDEPQADEPLKQASRLRE
ncbi:hypothetical protein CFAM422_006881 [Trichoderma lentiforme]|uniref:SSCRP protein n=1 Tax=Trichoderma lentiforme TaxID=1567552 RepID=A0A9P4XEA6_9HYPO|nr:hypothetical protein CFAM422_006881 [Trichoderma lentiforme]